MPRYYFHVQDGISRLDDEDGIVLPDAEAAWYQAVRSARELIRNDICGGRPGGYVEIADEQGWEVLAVPFDELMSLAV
ncbi:MAG TPA: hypothetical protein VGD19_01940 [Allosphingosinicella sp.]|jgi:hypothetical protein